MDNEKKSWDDIPALDLQDLQVEWDYRAEISNDKRRSQRLSDQELVKVFGVPCIPVKIATISSLNRGILQDISETGVAVRLQEALQVNERVKMGFFLGEEKILCKGIVRHVSEGSLGHTCGIKLVNVDEATKTRIHSVFVSVALKHGNSR